jgi:hypothetical protein
MFTFDITTHVRYDMVKPRGPIEVTLRRLDDRQLGPAVSWLLAGIPRMQRKLRREFAGPLGLDLTGPAGTRVTISSDGAAITVTPRVGSTVEPGGNHLAPPARPRAAQSRPVAPAQRWLPRADDSNDVE